VSAHGGELHVSRTDGLFVLDARVPEVDEAR
jgi:hypothetical protein